MASLRIVLPLALGLILLGGLPARAKATFKSSELEGQGTEILFCDLDGDHLKDAVLVDGLNLSIFYQDSKQGFIRKPQQQHRLADRPSILCAARLGNDAESLIVMTSEGVTELHFTDRTAPPSSRQIIKQQTIVPAALDEPQVIHLPFSAETGTASPLLLVPVAGGLQVWEHRQAWQQAQFIEHAVDTHLRPAVANPGYTQSFELRMALEDVNADGREDLMFMRDMVGGLQRYALHLQNADGRFTPEPSMTYTNKADWQTALCWIDMNRDGKVDLIKSTFLDETFFVPGMRSGKVLVAVYLADDQRRIRAEPQQIFRKNDWSSALPAVDVDGDGFMDLILGYIPVNTREGFRKVVTAEQVDLNLKFYFGRPGAGFGTESDCQRDVLIRFQRKFFLTAERRLYYEQFVNLNGDFNGDGRKDLLVRDSSHWISVYSFLSRQRGFNSKQDFRFVCPDPIDWWEVKDLNGDKVSDLIVKLRERKAFRIFTSQDK